MHDAHYPDALKSGFETFTVPAVAGACVTLDDDGDGELLALSYTTSM